MRPRKRFYETLGAQQPGTLTRCPAKATTTGASAAGWQAPRGETSAMEPAEYDLIVLGAGVAGENVADRAVQGGLTTALIEHELVGGECSYWACMPSKALLRSAQALRAARQVAGAAQAVTGELDVQAVLARRDSVPSNWADEGQGRGGAGAGLRPRPRQ